MNQIINHIKSKYPFYKRTVTVTFSPGQAILCSVIFLAIIIWFFFLGLILGRGQYPEQAIPEVSKMMPRANGTDVPLKLLTVEPSSRPETKIAVVEEEPTTQAAATSPKKSSRPAEKKIVQRVESNVTEKNIIPKRVKQYTKEVASKQNTLSATASEVFDYVYQVASFKDVQSANTLANKLKADGLKARVTSAQGGAVMWNRVVIDFRGTPTETNNLREHLSKHKIEKIMLLKKNAVK